MDIAAAQDVAAATETEHRLGLRASLRLYRKACLWSIFLSTCIIMEGFDLALLSGLFAYPPFQRRFGQPQPDPLQNRPGSGSGSGPGSGPGPGPASRATPSSSYQLSAAWQAGLTNGALCGQILGLFLNGIVAERLGYRTTLIGALLACLALVFITVFARTLPQLLVGEMLLGVPWGVFQTLATTYAAEVCPTSLRAYLTAYGNLCWVIGQLIAAGVLRAMLVRDDDWGFRIPFALQWAWPVPLALGIWAAPESPWWLVRRGRLEDAKRALASLTDRSRGDGSNNDGENHFDADQAVAMMVHTTLLEEAMVRGTSYLDLFRGVNLRRTEIVCVVWMIQTLCGASLMGYSTYFYEQAGLGIAQAFTMTLGQYALGAAGTVVSWFLMARFGRRSLYLAGLLLMAALFLATGLAALSIRDGKNSSSGSRSSSKGVDKTKAAQWAIGSLLLAYTFVYDCTIGPVCYCLVAELPSTRLRTKSMVLARNAYNIVGIASNVVTPRMLNPTAWNWGARCGFFWAASCLACAAWSFWRLPEPRGKTYGELDVLFEKGVRARKFERTVLAAVDGDRDESGGRSAVALVEGEKRKEDGELRRVGQGGGD